MSNQQIPPSQDDSQRLSLGQKIFNFAKQPRNQIIAGVTVTAIGVGAYAGTKYLVMNVIPTQAEKDLKNILDREVNIGEITSFSLNNLTIENTNIPASKNDPSFIEVEKIDVKFNLLSIFFNGSLPINVTVDNVVGYAQIDTLVKPFVKPSQEEKKLLPETLKLPNIPLTTPKITLELNNTDLQISPDAETEAIEVKAQAKLNFVYDQENQPLDYQFLAQINNSEIDIKGDFSLTTTQAKTQVNVADLNIHQVTDLVPQLPLDLEQGQINSNLKLEIPSLPEILETSAEGTLAITNVVGTIDWDELIDYKSPNLKKVLSTPGLNQYLTAEAFLRFQGQSITVELATANFGDLGGKITGSLGFNQGYNLQADLKPVKISKIYPILPFRIPVRADGLVTAKVAVTGEIDNPQVKANIRVNNTIIDRFILGKIESIFSANLDEIVLDKLHIKPSAGGELRASGLINTNLRDKLETGTAVDFSQMPLDFNLNADLPTTKLIASYYVLPPEVTMGNLQLKGQIQGNLTEPNAQVNWQIPSAQTSGLGEISGKGELTVIGKKIEITNTKLVANDGTVTVSGSGDLDKKKTGK